MFRFETCRLGAKPSDVDMLLLEQKAVLRYNESHMREFLRQQRLQLRGGNPILLSTCILDEGKATEELTPRMFYEQRHTDESLQKLLEKVFEAADEENKGTKSEFML